MNDILMWAGLALSALAAVGAWLAWSRSGGETATLEAMDMIGDSLAALREQQAALLAQQGRLERDLREDFAAGQRELRRENAEATRGLRTELIHALAQGQQVIGARQAEHSQLLNQQLDAFAQNLAALTTQLQDRFETLRASLTGESKLSREESAAALTQFGDRLADTLRVLGESTEQRIGTVRETVETRLRDLQQDNASKLEAMRQTVDEKLHATLEQRLGESFKLVSERLEAVHKGLGEMQTLATGVGDLKRVLSNVKSRGTWGEVQLAMLIEQTMTPDQYAKNVKPVPGSSEIVEFAIRLPGRDAHGAPVWLPIDAKFPKEEYERLSEAQDRADVDAVRVAGQAFERGVETEARRIRDKYVQPPHTTDFGIMFLPTEGLYAEVLRRPGLIDRLHALRINVAGPSTLAALLNSLQMGFRTLAIEQRSSEVWKVLGAVKTEFGKFGDALAAVKRTLDTASNKIGQTETRARVMQKHLRQVEALPEAETRTLLGNDEPNDDTPLMEET